MEAYALFVDAVSDNLYPAIVILERRAAGDYSPDENVQSFPAFADSPERTATGLGCWQLFEAYVRAAKLADGTVTRWRAVFLQMHRDLRTLGPLGLLKMPRVRGSRDWSPRIDPPKLCARFGYRLPAVCSAGRHPFR